MLGKSLYHMKALDVVCMVEAGHRQGVYYVAAEVVDTSQELSALGLHSRVVAVELK